MNNENKTNNDIAANIGRNIAALRRERGARQEDLAKFVNVTSQAVSKWENGGVPDAEMLPLIADFFEIPIDRLFGRRCPEKDSLANSVTVSLSALPMSERFATAFDCCVAIEEGLFSCSDYVPADYYTERQMNDATNHNIYSGIFCDSGYTSASFGPLFKYFFIVPEITESDFLLDGVNFCELFEALSDPDVFGTCVMLSRRDSKKKFTSSFLEKAMGYDATRAVEVLEKLKKFRLIKEAPVETDDGCYMAYTFYPSPSFVSMLIFAREILEEKRVSSISYKRRSLPYLK